MAPLSLLCLDASTSGSNIGERISGQPVARSIARQRRIERLHLRVCGRDRHKQEECARNEGPVRGAGITARVVNECGRELQLVPLDGLGGRASYVLRLVAQSESSRQFPLMPFLQLAEDHRTCQPLTQLHL